MLHMLDHAKASPDRSDWVWGAENIGRLIGRSASQVYYLHATGAFRDSVWKMGPKALVGSRSKLRELPARLASETSEI
jgi:hypothetical protein